MDKDRLDISLEDKDSIIFSGEDGAIVEDGPEDSAIMVWGDGAIVSAGSGEDTVVSTGKNSKISEGEFVEIYGDRSSVEAETVISGSNSGSKISARNVSVMFSKNSEIKGTDAADELWAGFSKRSGLEGGQDDDQISLSLSKDNVVFLGYQSLWTKTAALEKELGKLEDEESRLLEQREDLSGKIQLLELVLIDPKMVEKRNGLISERDALDDKLEEITAKKTKAISAVNREFKLGFKMDTKSTDISEALADFHDGDNSCEDFRGERNKIVCGKGDDTVTLIDCRNDTVISGSGSCLIKQENSAKSWGNVFIVGTGDDTIIGLTEKDTIIIGADWYASVLGETTESSTVTGDCTVWLEKPRVMSTEGEGAFLLLEQGIDLEDGETDSIDIQGKTYNIVDDGLSDIRVEVRAPETIQELEDGSGYETVGGGFLAEVRGKGDWSGKTGTVNDGLGKVERVGNYPLATANIVLETATDRKKISSTKVGEESVTLDSGEVVTVGQWEYTESNRGDIYGYVQMPTEEELEEYGDEYRDRSRYNILVNREISGKGTVTILGQRPVMKLVTDAGEISIVDWTKVPRVRGKFNYNYYNKE